MLRIYVRALPEPGTVVVPDTFKYGALYNWYAATDARLICADGWEVPTTTHLDALITYAGGSTIAGGALKEQGFIYWTTPNYGAVNSVFFNGRGAGFRQNSNGLFISLKSYNYLWTISENNSTTAHSRYLSYLNDDATSQALSKVFGFSIRLIKTTTSLTHGQTGTYTGNDGKVYRTICIGTQEWLADNLAETKFRNGDTIPLVTDNSAWAALTTAGMCYYNNDINNA